MHLLLASLVSIISAASPQPAPAPPQTLRPVADGMVYEGSKDRSYGLDPQLRVRGVLGASYQSYLRFDLANPSSVTAAKLRLRCTDSSPWAGHLYLVTDNGWTESSLTWRTKPAVQRDLGAVGAVSSGAWIEMDVSSVVTGPGKYVFALTQGGSNSAWFWAREGAEPPELVVESASDADGIWTSAAELAHLPTSGAAWNALVAEGGLSTGTPDLSDQDDDTDVRVLAKALVYARTNHSARRTEVIRACMAAIGTEVGGETLALGRNLAPYVIAADLVGLPATEDALFRKWLLTCLTENLAGRTLRSTHEDRPNNWGTHAGASRAAVAVYLGDTAEIERCAKVFKGWLGDRSSYAGFDYGDLSWQADASRPIGINPRGAMRNGHSIDGVLPDDQRRAGTFAWPPAKENYVWEALQGALVQAVILDRAGYDTWNWGDQALLRAVRWLHDQCNYPATGDDEWQPHLINHFLGTDFPAPVPARSGKNMGWTDWTHPPH